MILARWWTKSTNESENCNLSAVLNIFIKIILCQQNFDSKLTSWGGKIKKMHFQRQITATI